LIGVASAQRLHDLSHGRDARAVETERIEKSIGHEETFARDRSDRTGLVAELLRLSTRTGERLRARGIVARTIAIKVRFDSFETVTRSRTLVEASNATRRIYVTATELFDELMGGSGGVGGSGGEFVRPVRLIGVRAEQLQREGESGGGLWNDDEEWRSLDDAVDAVTQRFGSSGLRSARLLAPREDVVDPRSLEDPG